MNKKIKRFISVFLALALLALPSCGKNTEDADVVAEKESEMHFATLEVLPVDSEKGPGLNPSVKPQEFTVLVEADRGDLFADENATDAIDLAVYERNELLYENHSVRLIEKVVTDVTETVLNDMLSDSSDHDMLLLSAIDAASLINRGALADLEALDGFDSGAKGYAKNIIDSLSIGGRSFIATGDALPSFIRSVGAVIVAPEVYTKSSAPNFFEIVKSGNFTFETMLTHSRSLADINGVGGADLYIDAEASDALALFLGGGGIFFETNPVTDVYTSVDFTGANAALYSYLTSIYGIEQTDDMAEDEDAPEEYLFRIGTIGEAEEMRRQDPSYTVLPMPKSQASQENYVCTIDTGTALFTALPSNGKDNNSAVAVMNLIYSLSAPIKDSVVRSLGESDAAISVAELVFDSAYVDLPLLFGYGDTHSLLSSAINERISEKAFVIRGNERSAAIASALSILSGKLTK